MGNWVRKSSVLLLALLAIAACARTALVYNVEDDAVPMSAQHKLSQSQVGKIISDSAKAEGWTVQQVKPGHLRATVQWREHAATVDIRYSGAAYSIELDHSENLNEADGLIHPRYNDRVGHLESVINHHLNDAVTD